MQQLNRRDAMATAVLSGVACVPCKASDFDDESELNKDAKIVMEAGLTEAEAICWMRTAEAAGAFFKLPEVHPSDKQEVAAAIHVIQSKLLSRPTYRKYLEIHKRQSKKD